MRLNLKFPGCADCCGGVDPNCCLDPNNGAPLNRYYFNGINIDNCETWAGGSSVIDVDVTNYAQANPFFSLSGSTPTRWVLCTTPAEGTTLSAMVGLERTIVAWLGNGVDIPYDEAKSARDALSVRGAVICGSQLGSNAFLHLADYWIVCEVWPAVDDLFPEEAPPDPSFQFWRFNPFGSPIDATETFNPSALTHGIAQGGILIDEVNVLRWARLPEWSNILALGDLADGYMTTSICFYSPVRIYEESNFKTIAWWQTQGPEYIIDLVPDDWITPLDPPVCGSEYTAFFTPYILGTFGPQSTIPADDRLSTLVLVGEWEHELTWPGDPNLAIRAEIAFQDRGGFHTPYCTYETDYGEGYPATPATPQPITSCNFTVIECVPVTTDPLPVRARYRVYVDQTTDPWPLDVSEIGGQITQTSETLICPP